MLGRKRAAAIRAATGHMVHLGEAELRHAARHFLLPRDLLLRLVTRVLRTPTVVFLDDRHTPHIYHLFYRLDDGRYIVAVVKLTADGAFFASMYPTGRTVRPSHRRLRRITL